MTADVENAMLQYEWPGNVRELENTIHGLVVSCNKTIVSCSDLPANITSYSTCSESISIVPSFKIGQASLKDMMRDIEYDLINEAITICGSISNAADVLQVNRTTLFRKLKAVEKQGFANKEPS